MERTLTGKFQLLSTVAPATVETLKRDRRMTGLMRKASDTLEGLLRPLVLIVDDDRDFRDGLRAYLQASELCRSIAVASAELALDVLDRDQVELVVTDYQMPVMDGAALLRVVRKRWPHVIRVMMSASSVPEEYDELMDGFMRKQETLMVMADTLLSLIPEP